MHKIAKGLHLHSQVHNNLHKGCPCSPSRDRLILGSEVRRGGGGKLAGSSLEGLWPRGRIHNDNDTYMTTEGRRFCCADFAMMMIFMTTTTFFPPFPHCHCLLVTVGDWGGRSSTTITTTRTTTNPFPFQLLFWELMGDEVRVDSPILGHCCSFLPVALPFCTCKK